MIIAGVLIAAVIIIAGIVQTKNRQATKIDNDDTGSVSEAKVDVYSVNGKVKKVLPQGLEIEIPVPHINEELGLAELAYDLRTVTTNEDTFISRDNSTAEVSLKLSDVKVNSEVVVYSAESYKNSQNLQALRIEIIR